MPFMVAVSQTGSTRFPAVLSLLSPACPGVPAHDDGEMR